MVMRSGRGNLTAKMVADYKFLLGLVLACSLITEAALGATQHVVGGSQGWDQSTDFGSWTSGQTFKAGDQLVFKYTSGLHSVVELGSESAYKKCDIGSAVNSLSGGNNAVKLKTPGTRYFACGTSGHCQQGMKVKIATVAADASPTTTNTTTTPASSSSSSSPPSTSTAPPGFHFFAAVVLVATSAVAISFSPLF